MTHATHLCDRCGRPLTRQDNRYVAKIQVFAAADPLEVTAEDLARDHALLREHLLEQAEAMSEEELMQDVYVALEFSLCRPCQRAWLENPLGGTARQFTS